MHFDPFSEIKLAEKAATVSEQREHLREIKDMLADFIKKDEPIPKMQEIYDKIEQIEKALASAKDPVQISPELIEQIKTVSAHPIVKRIVQNRTAEVPRARTLFDYTD